MQPNAHRPRLSCSSHGDPPDAGSDAPPDQQTWDDESEVVARRSRTTTLEPEAMDALLSLARAPNVGAAKSSVEQLASHGDPGRLAPLLDALVARAAEVEHLRRLAGRDELTGLANRRTFNDVLERELARSDRAQQPLALLLLDLDHLKRINDRLGHAAGDHALRTLAQSAEASVRSGDVVARLGGDEFAVVLPNTSLCEAVAVGQRIREHALASSSDSAQLGLSFGAATTDGVNATAEALLREADRSLYSDKLSRKASRG